MQNNKQILNDNTITGDHVMCNSILIQIKLFKLNN
jgi:hypothetical protein